MSNTSSFDPFLSDRSRSHAARSWLIATGLQALFTCALLGASRWADGKPYEMHARLIVCVGVVATWSLALRTIRARLLELIAYWRKASMGALRKASESGRHLIQSPLKPAHERYIKGSIRRLRIIAAGLTIPFFTLPLMWTFISAFLSLRRNGSTAETWASASCFMLFNAVIVAGYFHWSIVPSRQPVRTTSARAHAWKPRP